jgi:hypothetical protein
MASDGAMRSASGQGAWSSWRLQASSETDPHALKIPVRFADRGTAGAFDVDEAAGLTAAFGARVAKVRAWISALCFRGAAA